MMLSIIALLFALGASSLAYRAATRGDVRDR